MYYIDEFEVPYNKYHTYKIRKGDTLQSVADELGIDAQELRRYHNIHCAIHDLIEADFKSHLEFLILAPEKSEVATASVETPRKKVIFGSNAFTIPFYPVNINNNYNVQYTIEKGNQINHIEYQVSVKWLGADKNGICFFEIDRLSKVKINGKETYTKVDELAENAGSVLYPMHVVIDQNGNWIDVFNYKTIKERWEDKKTEIIENYDGIQVLRYIDAVQDILKNEESLVKSLSDDWFFKVFFNGVHTCYGADLVIDKEAEFSIIPKNAIIKINTEQKIEEYLNQSNLIVIKQNGELTDEDLKEEFLIDKEFLGNYKAEYLLNPNHYSIEKIDLKCILNLNVPKKVTIEINNLNKKKEVAIASRKSIFIAEEKKKNNFFKGLFGRF